MSELPDKQRWEEEQQRMLWCIAEFHNLAHDMLANKHVAHGMIISAMASAKAAFAADCVVATEAGKPRP